ncbi:GatB/YqeY domain-containing protein [Prosthecochloris sp. N3]|uniref:GatB/YqeY domain-containing protein n=1 Tax=Prosthecochloris ethylica TaxID=2743976 RepID=A0ABR9XS29_9CHLB|nr:MULTISPECIES: GatB/YqeY domain-containing protein [Prosthecochloris]MEC9486616.1 GatB/YqeY domain-containing protein [Prosthecochloris sp.]MBF0586776.1 GatB/YqeY domain-containing protein [Prosthecochloris ethylica]MBF0636682.1 GatB/YqeY domain-containing protein [Prosthecochloris ethylica]NUK47919.1 GatB/YqeY domain-containing protein [Prosthecochloris ethylica]RNA65221.1 GatB/YqeY domain-containing protein [Prosthecochloris sp. ZM_2]
MSIREQINADLKEAMKSGDKERLNAIRSIRAALLEKEVSVRVGGKGELTPEQELDVVTGLAKKRRDSIEQYLNAGRKDLAETEESELRVLETYLPEQLSDEEIQQAVDAIITSTGASSMKDMGRVMGAAMKELKGKADGGKVQQFVKAALSD